MSNTVTLTVEEVLGIDKSLKSIKDKPVSSKLGFIFGRLSSKISPIVIQFNEANNNLIKKYGENIGGGSFKVTEDNLLEYSKELDSIIKMEETIDFPAIKLELFDDSYTGEFFKDLNKFIEE